jgi:hypothetical protein
MIPACTCMGYTDGIVRTRTATGEQLRSVRIKPLKCCGYYTRMPTRNNTLDHFDRFDRRVVILLLILSFFLPRTETKITNVQATKYARLRSCTR